MSISVAVAEIPSQVAGRWGYLVLAGGTDVSGTDSPAKVVALSPSLSSTKLVFDAGTGGMFRRAERAGVGTFVVVPNGDGEFGEYSLVIDGTVSTDGEMIVFDPTSAVWHRPAPPLR